MDSKKDKRFSGKSVLITGGSRGIGSATARAFAAEGADVAINYNKSEEEAARVVSFAKEQGARAEMFRADTSNSREVGEMLRAVVDSFGKLDVLVNNAGVLKRTPFLDISEAEWDWIIDTNLKGYFLVGQAAAKQMVKSGTRGSIINISSNGQERPGVNVSHYNTSKAGVAMLTKSMAFELAPHGIRVNAVAPGLTETDMNRKDIANDSWREMRLARIPLKIVERPEDITGAVLFLCSDEARAATGTTIFVDAGAFIG